MADTRYVLAPTNRGYKIEKRVADKDFNPPIWVLAGYLNCGRTFPTRSAARDYMLSRSEGGEGSDA